MREVPTLFSSREELLARLREAIPGIDEESLTASDSSTQVVFAREVELTDEQLGRLGLTR